MTNFASCYIFSSTFLIADIPCIIISIIFGVTSLN